MQTLADQVAAEWSAIDPAARSVCIQCGKQFPIVRTGVVTTWEQSIVCPYCGFVPSDACCRSILDELAKRRSSAAPPAAPEPAKEEESARDDPPGLADVIGNAPAVLQIRTALDAHRARLAKVDGRTAGAKMIVFPHILLVGPAGSGKTTLAGIVARECKHKCHEQLGQSLNDPRAMVEALLKLKAGDILYIDEIHGLKRTCTETLYKALEERQVMPISARGKASPVPVRLPPFTLIGSTTDEYKLTDSFKQRFQYHIQLRRMTVPELAGAISQRAARSNVKLDFTAAEMISARSHGTPRKAVMLLNRCIDTALAGDTDIIDSLVVESACAMAELDGLGLTSSGRSYLRTLADSNVPVRLNVLASTLSVPARVVENEIERDLVCLGLITKNEKGRVLTSAGRNHLKGSP